MQSAKIQAHGLSVQGCFSAMWHNLNENTREILCAKAEVENRRFSRFSYADIENLLKAAATLAETANTINRENLQGGKIRQAGVTA